MVYKQIDRKEILSFYNWATPQIFKDCSADRIAKWVNPYWRFKWEDIFTPIEKETWEAIRCFGHSPFYPQYPVLNYFVDFGNPVVKVAIECDGKDFHKDKEKDNKRDIDLLEHGWTVYRITGAYCVKGMPRGYYNLDDFYATSKINILTEFYKRIDGLIKAIGVYYFGYQSYYRYPDELFLIRECLNNSVSLPDKRIHDGEIVDEDYHELLKRDEDEAMGTL